MHLALIGYGNIGRMLVGMLPHHLPRPLDRLTLLVRPGANDPTADLPGDGSIASVITTVSDAEHLIAAAPDLAIECAGHEAVATFVPDLLAAGIPTVISSTGALSDETLEATLASAAGAGQCRLILPAGAIGGVDMLSALKPSGVTAVTYTGRKPPRAWAGSPADTLCDLENLKTATAFFDGTAREAARDFPKNANVAATIALAGIGFDETRVKLIADPAATGNTHHYQVTAGGADFEITITGKSSPDNPRTSIATAYSLLREVRNAFGPVSV